MARGLSGRDPTHQARSESLSFGNGNRKQLAVARKEFPTFGIDFVSVREALDTSTPMGNAMFTIVPAMREESGSITPMERKAARQSSLRTTVLALNTRPCMVSSWRAVRVLKTDDRAATSAGSTPILRRSGWQGMRNPHRLKQFWISESHGYRFDHTVSAFCRRGSSRPFER
jgi:DNA invertase Pin-like site-specific DNA recombinase